MRYRYYTADVFTDRIFGGNPLAVFPEAKGLSAEQMQRVARELNISETVFVLPAESKDHHCRLRIFTPAMELPFAGHPTLGAAHVLAILGEIEVKSGEAEVVFEEGIGPITVRITADGQLPTFTQLSVAKMPEHAMEIPSLRSIASALSLDISDLLLGDDRPMAVSCGVPFLIVPLRNLESLGRAKLDRETWENTLQDSWAPHIYAFVYEAETEGADLRARMFAPAMGIEEDPATGAAASALAGYLAAQEKNAQGSRFWTLEQGFEMGRPSLLKVEAEIESGEVTAIRVGGASVLVSECRIEIPEPGASGGLVLEPAAEAPAEPKAPPMEPLPQAVAKPTPAVDEKEEKEDAAKPETKKDDQGTEVSAVRNEAPEAKAAPASAEDEAPEAKAEPAADKDAKPATPSPPAAEDAADGDKVVPLRSVLKALTSDADKEPKQDKKETAQAPAEAKAETSEETPKETPEPKRPIGFVVEPKPEAAAEREEKKPDEAPATEERASKLSSLLRVGPFTDSKTGDEKPAANGKAPDAEESAGDPGKAEGAKASVSIRLEEAAGRAAESFEDEDDFDDETEDDFDETLDALDEEAEDAAEADEEPGDLDDYDEDDAYDEDELDDDDDEEDAPEDEDSLSAEQFKNQKHYKFLWSGTLRHGDQIYGCVIIDLSSKAALVQLEEELAYDLTLNFDSPVTLKNEKIGRLKGEVVWREKNRLGVELLEDPKEVIRILEAARK